MLRQRHAEVVNQMLLLTDGKGERFDKTKFDRLDRESTELRQQIADAERRAGVPPQQSLGGDYDGVETSEDKAHVRAFRQYLRVGVNQLSDENRKTLDAHRAWLSTERRDTTTTMGGGGVSAYPGAAGTAGGFLIPTGFQREIILAMKYAGPMVDDAVVRVLPTDSGAPLPIPTVNDVDNIGELIGEGASANQADVAVGMGLLGSFKFSSKIVKCSLELLNDSAFDLDQWLTDLFAIRFGRVLNSYFTTGSGTSEPHGIVTDAVAAGNLVTAQGSYSSDGIGGANTIGVDDLINLQHAVDPLYRRDPSCRYMFSDGTLRSIKSLKDKFGRSLWLPAVSGSAPETILGFPYSVNPWMDSLQTSLSSPATTKNTVLFGPTNYFIYRRVKDMAVLRLSERYAEFGVVGFLAWMRGDGALITATGSKPIAVLQNIA